MTVTLTIPDVDEVVVERLRIRAEAYGTTLEDEARAALCADVTSRAAKTPPMGNSHLIDRICRRFGALGGWEMPHVDRSSNRPLPAFD
jgi:plasmid stability protein